MSRNAWLMERKNGLGSSDVAALYGCGYMTELELYNDKTSDKIEEKEANFAMQKGTDLEPTIRKAFASLYNLTNMTDETFDPVNVSLADLPIIRASLDGASKDMSIIIEIKYQGEGNHLKVADETLPLRGGRVQERYWIQCQHGLLASGAKVCHLVSFNPDCKRDMLSVEIYPDEEFLKNHIKKCADFWERVMLKMPPQLSDNDYDIIEDNNDLSLRYIELSSKIEALTKEREAIKEKIVSNIKHPKTKYGRLLITSVEKQGSIQYSKIDLIKDMSQDELEKYRGKSTTYYKISLIQP